MDKIEYLCFPFNAFGLTGSTKIAQRCAIWSSPMQAAFSVAKCHWLDKTSSEIQRHVMQL
ncbi:hypothetical protein LZ023_39410 (plasmid) [Pseudomonas silvicola]|nr:hypothetical protein LZ023_39410 [Pseudomonas silvicola]